MILFAMPVIGEYTILNKKFMEIKMKFGKFEIEPETLITGILIIGLVSVMIIAALRAR